MSIPTAQQLHRNEQRLRFQYPDYYARYLAVVELLTEDLERYHHFYQAAGMLVPTSRGFWTLVLNTMVDAGRITRPPMTIDLHLDHSLGLVNTVEIVFRDEDRLKATL